MFFLSGRFSIQKKTISVLEVEQNKILRLAQQIKRDYLYPSNLERLSTKPALSIFHEKTVAALKHYSGNENDYTGTFSLIESILIVWKILNVKTPETGKVKRDIWRDPIKDGNDLKLLVLAQFGEFLREWKQSPMQGLTKPISLAWCQTLSATIACAKYLIGQCHFSYVMLGNLQSDPIERRFGIYRQSHGGNYYISIRQLLETERKLRAVSLTKYSRFQPSELENFTVDDSIADADANDYFGCISDLPTPIPDEADQSAIFYVTCALCNVETKKRNCACCTELLVSNPHADLPDSVDSSVSRFFNSLNRSGLVQPTDLALQIIQFRRVGSYSL